MSLTSQSGVASGAAVPASVAAGTGVETGGSVGGGGVGDGSNRPTIVLQAIAKAANKTGNHALLFPVKSHCPFRRVFAPTHRPEQGRSICTPIISQASMTGNTASQSRDGAGRRESVATAARLDVWYNPLR